MKVTISSSSRDEISEIYKEESRKILSYLASDGCILNWGSGDRGIMGLCYEEFDKKGCKIYGYTSPKYIDELTSLPNAEHKVYDDTFDLKKNIFNDGDIVICLPGGTGTISEAFAYLEEIRSNDINKPLIMCNINGCFDGFINCINEAIKNNFNSESIFEYFKVVNSFEEFKTLYEEIKNSLVVN